MSYTLAQIRELAKQRADMENSSFISDAEWTTMINGSYGELYDLITVQFEDYYLAEPLSFTLTNQNTKDLPADFYKLRGLDVLDGSRWSNVREFNFGERNRFSGVVSGFYGRQKTYRVMGQKIYLLPEIDPAGQYRLWYIPRIKKLVSEADLMGDVLDFEEYVVVDSAIKALIKEESDPSALMKQKADMASRVITMAADRSVDQPERVTDVSGSAQGRIIWSGF